MTSTQENDHTEKSNLNPPEIELKYMVDVSHFGDLDLRDYPCEQIEQGYIFIGENKDEIRVRSIYKEEESSYFMTFKRGSGLKREEVEIPITEDAFNRYWKYTYSNGQIEKMRYTIPYTIGERTYNISLDRYMGSLLGLYTAEVEFSSEEEAASFVPPLWMSEDVTNDPKFKNQNLAHKGEMEDIEEANQNQEKYPINEGMDILVQKVLDLIEREKRVVISIGGPTNSGKTSKGSAELKRRLEEIGINVRIESLDHYYIGNKAIEERGITIEDMLNWDDPQAVDLFSAYKNIIAMKMGHSIYSPVYSMAKGEKVGEDFIDSANLQVIIVEGLFALTDPIIKASDINVFVNASMHGILIRKLIRDSIDPERGAFPPSQLLRYFTQVVIPMHRKYVMNTQKRADIVLLNDLNPSIESKRIDMVENQIKFPTKYTLDTLRRLGAERITTVKQVDDYYNPDEDPNKLSDTGEVIRIRVEGDNALKRIMTYKGPAEINKIRQRAKIEFPIDDVTYNTIKSLYSSDVTIYKTRSIYQLGFLVFSLDEVFVKYNGSNRHIGNFIELRLSKEQMRGMQSDPNILKLVEKNLTDLGLNLEEGIKHSYFELATLSAA